MIVFFCFHTIPLFCGFFYSLTNSKGFGVYDFIGLKNYLKLFQNAQVMNAYMFTFKFAVVITVSSVIACVLVSSMVSYTIARNMQHKKIYKFFYYYLVSAMFVPFSLLKLPLVKQMEFASYILALLPMLLFYLAAQKQIINGVTNGAVKG